MKRKSKLQLFVFEDFSPDYTSGLAIAIASTEKEARKLITKERGFDVYDWGRVSIHPLNKKFAASVLGGG